MNRIARDAIHPANRTGWNDSSAHAVDCKTAFALRQSGKRDIPTQTSPTGAICATDVVVVDLAYTKMSF